jgi:acyl-CoA dehydrogenase
MTSELELLAATARDILATTLAEAQESCWSPAAWQAMEEAGLTRIGVPEDLGGSGGSPADFAAVLYATGQQAAPLPLADAIIGGWLLSAARIQLPGGLLTAGQGAAAVPRRGGWTISGTVPRVPWGRSADNIAVLADSPEGPVVALLPLGGLQIAAGQNLAGEPRDTLELPSVMVPADRAATVPDRVRTQLLLRGAFSRILLMAGAAESTLALSARYASERVQFGRTISRFQAVQHTIARITAETAILHAAARAAVRAADGDTMRFLPLAAAKAGSGQAAGAVATMAHQVHGAMGFTQEHPLRLLTTRLWSWRDEFGSGGEWAARIGRWVTENGAAALARALADDEPGDG